MGAAIISPISIFFLNLKNLSLLQQSLAAPRQTVLVKRTFDVTKPNLVISELVNWNI